jgi:hypothetical protein
MIIQTPSAGVLGSLPIGALTGGLTASSVRAIITKFSWVNADVVSLGAATSGNLLVTTLPAKTLVQSARIVITGQGAGPTTLTCGLGITASLYVDYIVAKDAKAAANTIYGNVFADLGTNLSALVGSLPSLSTTTAVNLQFVSTVANLSTVTGSTGTVYLETILLP